MSYILDALKKSETERAHNLNVNPPALQLHPRIPEKRTVALPVLVIAFIGLGIGGFYAWKYVLQLQASTIEKTATKINPPDKTMLVTALVNKDITKPKQMITEPKFEATPVIKRRVRPIPKTKPKPLPTKKPTVAKELQHPRVVFSETFLDGPGLDNSMTNKKPGTVEIATRSLDEVPNISGLPLQVRNKIPSMSFDGHVYSSKASQRSVMLNGRKMREGEIVSSNLSLEKITARGAEFKFDGYRFKLGALQDWSQ